MKVRYLDQRFSSSLVDLLLHRALGSLDDSEGNIIFIYLPKRLYCVKPEMRSN
ncbi:MAG: hypothetical protein LBB80_10510 [Treponema sp.]|jgi:hypothetical protein|nr:hypothetical protein [Treponema sp.]